MGNAEDPAVVQQHAPEIRRASRVRAARRADRIGLRIEDARGRWTIWNAEDPTVRHQHDPYKLTTKATDAFARHIQPRHDAARVPGLLEHGKDARAQRAPLPIPGLARVHVQVPRHAEARGGDPEGHVPVVEAHGPQVEALAGRRVGPLDAIDHDADRIDFLGRLDAKGALGHPRKARDGHAPVQEAPDPRRGRAQDRPGLGHARARLGCQRVPRGRRGLGQSELHPLAVVGRAGRGGGARDGGGHDLLVHRAVGRDRA